MVPVVGRDEEPLRVGVREQQLNAGGGRTPEREATVVVVVRDDGDEGALAADEEGRRTVAWPLLDLRQLQADPPQPLEDAGALPAPAQRRAFRARSIWRFASRSATERRLSIVSLPRASASSTLTRPSLK